MENIFHHIVETLQNASEPLVYVTLFLCAVIENIFPPIPGDTITAFGAFLVGTGRVSYIGVYISTVLGSTLGFFLLYLIGKYFGRSHFLEKDYRFFPAKSILAAEDWFRKFGYWLVLINRFFPGIRSVISLSAGISGLTPLRVCIYSLVSASVWNLIWIHAGYTLGSNWETVKIKLQQIMRTYNIAFAIIAGMAIAAYLIFRISKRGRKSPPKK